MPQYDARALEEEAKKKRRDEGAATEESAPELDVALQKTGGNRALARLLNPEEPDLEQEQREEEVNLLPGGVSPKKLKEQAPSLEPVLKLIEEKPPGELPHPSELTEKIRPTVEQPIGADRIKSEARSRLRRELPKTPGLDPDRMLDNLCRAIAESWKAWQEQVVLVGVVIDGPTALGGLLVGPDLDHLLKTNSSGGSGKEEVEATDTFLAAFGAAFRRWQDSVKVPGLPLYPAFAAYPGALAPPMPNIPTPFKSFTHLLSGFETLGGFGIKDEVAAELCMALGAALNTLFPQWLDRTTVINLLGTGPVPTFAPPHIPAGPVVGGIAIAVPGFLVTS